MSEAVWVVLQKELGQETNQEETDCAWCLRDAGEEMGNGSHGICSEHAEREYQEWRSRRDGAA